ncbi:MAG: arsenate reductase ArsC [Bdellovibrionales bacterium]
MPNDQPLTVLFLSTGNAARSIVAEALLRERAGVRGGRFLARSAGMAPAREAHKHTLALLASEGVSLAGLHPKAWQDYYASASFMPIGVIVTLSEAARQECPDWPGKPVRVHWAVDDPLSATKEDVREWKFRKCFSTLDARISALIKTRAAQNAGELLLQLKDIGMVV